MPVEKSAGAVIFRKEGKSILFLLIQYGRGHWDFPRGLIEAEETPEITAKREIGEETGITDLVFLPNFKETIKFFFKFEGQNILKFVTYFLAQTSQKEVRLSYEHQDFKWLDFKEALAQTTFKEAKKALTMVNEYLTKRATLNI